MGQRLHSLSRGDVASGSVHYSMGRAVLESSYKACAASQLNARAKAVLLSGALTAPYGSIYGCFSWEVACSNDCTQNCLGVGESCAVNLFSYFLLGLIMVWCKSTSTQVIEQFFACVFASFDVNCR